MTASYPLSVKTFTTKVDFADTVLAAHVNDLQDEVNSLEATLGTSIKTGSGWVGSFDQITTNWNTLKDRLANIEYGLNIAYGAKLPTGGTTGQVLVKTSGSDYAVSWSTFDGLPSQTGNNGKYLTTDGSSASWATAVSYSAPTLGSTAISSGATVSNVDGLTINSTTIPTSKTLVATDSTVYVVPSQTGNAGKYLTTDGNTSSWETVSIVPDTFSQFLLAGC